MCGRYTVISDDDIAELRTIIPGFRGHISGSLEAKTALPGMDIPVLTQHGDFMNAKWGFKKWDGKGLVFNARAETLVTSGFFAPHLSFGRCIAPAREYFEWQNDPDEPKKKLKYRIYSDSGLLYLCALMRPSDGGFEYTIVTKPAEPDISYIHPRMPVVFDADGARGWLNSPILDLKAKVRLTGQLQGETG